MKSKLTLAFLRNLKDDKVSIQSIASATSCTPGQLLDFINQLIGYGIVKIVNNEIILIDKGEMFINFKRLNVQVTRTFKTQELSNICDRMNEALFSVVNHIYHNDGCDEISIAKALPDIKNINNAIILLESFKTIARVAGEYYCALGANDFKLLCERVKLRGITLNSAKNNDFITANFSFSCYEFNQKIDCLKNPTTILCDLFFNCETDERKRKLMIENLNLFAKYRTAIDMKNSEFAVVDDKTLTKRELDFNLPLVNQIADQIQEHKENGKTIKFYVSIKLNGIR